MLTAHSYCMPYVHLISSNLARYPRLHCLKPTRTSRTNFLHPFKRLLGHTAAFVVSFTISRRPERLHAGVSEPASTNTGLEQHVHLSIRSAFWFWQAEVRPERTQSTGSRPEEAGFGAPIPRCWVEHVRSEDIGDYTGDVVEIACEDNGFVAQAGGGDLGD